jgi:hypothetical protein
MAKKIWPIEKFSEIIRNPISDLPACSVASKKSKAIPVTGLGGL